MKSTLRWTPLAGAILLSACTYGIVLDPGGQGVRVAWNGNLGVRVCRDVGKVTVSVLSRVGPVDRNDIKVRDELEIMARNQAAQMHADTIVPLGEPHDGEQSWEGYSCGTVLPPPGYHEVSPQGDRELPPPGYHYVPPVDRRPQASAYPPGSGAPVEDVPNEGPPPSAYAPPPPGYAPPPGYSPPPPDPAQPPPFGAPVPAGGAQTYPISGSSG